MKVSLLFTSILILLIGLTACNPFGNKKSTGGLIAHYPSSDKDYYQEDSLTGHFHKPNVTRSFEWNEHPKGKIVMKTNNLGLRNDSAVVQRKELNTYRILITGDSHVDGVIYNHESVATHLQDKLNDQDTTRKFEVLNAGNGYFGPQNYQGVYQKFIDFNPDLYIVIIYTGNDFIDAIRIEAENKRMKVPERPDDYYEPLWAIDELYIGFTGQYMNQLKFFHTFPNYTDSALHIARRSLLEIKTMCLSNKTQFLTILLPSKIDTEYYTDRIRIDTVMQIMGFDDEIIQNNRQLVKDLTGILKTTQIQYLDLYSHFKSSKDELFWKTDYHVNAEGHKYMANIIFNYITSEKL